MWWTMPFGRCCLITTEKKNAFELVYEVLFLTQSQAVYQTVSQYLSRGTSVSIDASRTKVLWSNFSNVTSHAFLGVHRTHLHSKASKKFCSKAFLLKTIQPCTSQTHLIVKTPLLTVFSLIGAVLNGTHKALRTWCQDSMTWKRQQRLKLICTWAKCLFTSILNRCPAMVAKLLHRVLV